MATVRITDAVVSTIVKNAHASFATRFNQIEKDTVNYLQGNNFGDQIISAWLKSRGLTEIEKQLPEDFYTPRDHLSLNRINGTAMSPFSHLKLTRDTPVLIAMVTNPNSSYIGSKAVTLEDAPELQHFVDVVAKAKLASAEIENERVNFMAAVRQLLNTCTSLKQAIDRWPQIVELLDGDLKERHYRVTTRSAAKEKVNALDLDITSLNTSLVVNKISGRIAE